MIHRMCLEMNNPFPFNDDNDNISPNKKIIIVYETV